MSQRSTSLRSSRGASRLHDRILSQVEAYNEQARSVDGAVVIPKEHIELPDVFCEPRVDETGELFVEDLNGIVRYYLESGEVVPTAKTVEAMKLYQSTERAHDFRSVIE